MALFRKEPNAQEPQMPSRKQEAEREIIEELSKNSSDDLSSEFIEEDEEELNLLMSQPSPSLIQDATFEKSSDQNAEKPTRRDDSSIDLERKRTLSEIEANFAALRSKYPMGGFKASRFLTTDVLMKAPEDFFAPYASTVQEIVNRVQTKLSDSKSTEVVSKAGEDPTNEALQEAAYNKVSALASSAAENYPYRGTEKNLIVNLVCSEIIGFGPLEPLWRDRRITEILVNGPFDVQVEVGGQIYKVKSCKFRSRAHLSSLLERLFINVGKILSATTPLVNGRLHDNSRIYAVDVSSAPAGPNFSIRRHPDRYTTPQEYLSWGACSEEMMVDLGNIIYRGASFLVSGGTGTGKTTFINSMSAFFPTGSRVLTLEDNLEMKLHPKKYLAAPMETVPSKPDQPGSGVTMRDLVKGSLRLRPDGIIVGEVRDEAAYDLCQALNTGHWGASTVHANNEHQAVYRMVSLVSQGGLMGGDAAYPLIAAAFDIIIQLRRFPEDGSRRIVSVSEVAPYPEWDNESGRMTLRTTPLWEFKHEGLVDGRVVGHWEKVNEMSSVRRANLMLDSTPRLDWNSLQKVAEI